MNMHACQLTHLMVSEVTVTESRGYQQLSIMPNALIQHMVPYQTVSHHTSV